MVGVIVLGNIGLHSAESVSGLTPMSDFTVEKKVERVHA